MKYRSVFISDTHLGSKACQAEALAKFIKEVECDKIYYVGDIIDFWKMKNGLYWPPAHNKVLRRITKKARDVDSFYLPGNHDEIVKPYSNSEFGFIEIRNQVTHYGVDGKKYLVTHGDKFDPVICSNKWLARFGSRAYDYLIRLNTLFNKVRAMFGKDYWSLAGYLKFKAKEATKVIDNFQTVFLRYAEEHGYNGVICGHIHHPEIKTVDGITYMNCGDWVENCTALVEHVDGRWEIIRGSLAAQGKGL